MKATVYPRSISLSTAYTLYEPNFFLERKREYCLPCYNIPIMPELVCIINMVHFAIHRTAALHFAKLKEKEKKNNIA